MSDQAPGNGSPNSPSGTGAPAALTEEAVAKIASDTMNSVFEGRSKKLKRELLEEFGKGLEPISKQIADLAAAASQPVGKKKKEGEPSEDGNSPEMRGLQRQLQEQKATTDAVLQKLAAAEAKEKSTTLRARLSEELGKHGITETPRVKAATAVLLSENRVRYDEDGQIVFAESEDSVLDLATGIKAWVKLDDNKIFLPPTGARGSGDRPGQGPKSGTQPGAEPSATEIGLAFAREFGGIPVSG